MGLWHAKLFGGEDADTAHATWAHDPLQRLGGTTDNAAKGSAWVSTCRKLSK
jgi:hypothetical protein